MGFWDSSPLLDNPGAVAAGAVGDPSQNSPLPNLVPNFSPDITNLLPANQSPATMATPYDSAFPLPFGDVSSLYGPLSPDVYGGAGSPQAVAADTSGNQLNWAGVTGVIGSLLSPLENAFLVNPANAQTQAQLLGAQTQAQASLLGAQTQANLLQSSNLFSYLIIGGIIFLIYKVLAK